MFSLLLALLLATPQADAARTKDIASFYGVRENHLTGAGLVVGLTRTGDSRRSAASIRALANRLQGLGVSLDPDEVMARNVALVMVTASIQSDSRTGSTLDVTVASTGDAASLMGGYLLMTPLMGPDGQVYAVASGPLIVGGYSVEAGGDSAQKNTPTVGRVENGATVEREVGTAVHYQELLEVDLVLRDPDFTTSSRLADAINKDFNEEIALASSSSTVRLAIPQEFQGRFALFAAKVEAVEVDVDAPARVVISERTGTVVMGADVRISAVAVAHGSLSIEVKRQVDVSQPGPLSKGSTVAVANHEVSASEEPGQLTLVEGVTIGELVSALNAMGVKPRDLMVILQAIQAAGALHAEIVAI